MLCLGAPRLEATDLQELDACEFSRRFKVASKLGQGGFADVLCVKDAYANQQQAALKVLRPSPAACSGMCEAGRCSHGPAQAPEVSLFREARALKHAKHPNVVELHSVVHIPKACVSDSSVSSRGKKDKLGGSCWGILLELLQGGSLQQQIYKVMSQPHSSNYSYVDALTWATDIAAAVSHLHSLNPVIIHRDLKLENILLLKPSAQGTAGGRKLPVAKLTDFGLHVMIDRPPAPFFITTGEDGMPLLILQPQEKPGSPPPQQQQKQQQEQQQEQEQQERLTEKTLSTSQQQQQEQRQDPELLLAPDAVSTAAAATGDQDRLTASSGSSSTPDAYAAADAEARVASASSRNSSSTNKTQSFVSALKGAHQQQQQQVAEVKLKHVVFAEPSPPAEQVAQTQSEGLPDIAAAADTAAPAPDGSAHASPRRRSLSNEPLPALQQQQPQWTRLTAGSLRRLSIGSYRSNSGSSAPPVKSDVSGCGSGSRARRNSAQPREIPLMLQPPCNNQSSSFVNAAVPSLAFAAEGDNGSVTGAELLTLGSPKSGHGSGGGSSSGSIAAESALSGGVEGLGDGSMTSILAAANSQKDYEVSLKPAALAAHHLAAHRKAGAGSTTSANYARSFASGDSGGAAGTASQAGEEGDGGTGAPSVSRMSVRSGEWPTAASMMWEDLMEDEVEQELLLDGGVPAVGGVHGGALIELPLSYNLTGHTGSFMYMAPEVFKRKPYNESVDVFSMGVMLYELFSRSLLIYTHTPANSPADCEHYASRIADGFRPKRVKLITDEAWEIIDACWQQDPTARPSASQVYVKLQKLLHQAQAGAAAKGSKPAFGKLFGRAGPCQEQVPVAVAAAVNPAAEAQVTPCTAATAAPAAAKSVATAAPSQKIAVDATSAAYPPARPRAEPACGCVIC